jgi:hypothetical protein
MADQDKPIEEQIAEAREAVFSSLQDPTATAQHRRRLAENLTKLCSRQIVEQQLANQPAPILLKEMRK